ncbi:hypothetical protein Glove_124g17 [Diversispora epigaea]|uniref:Major facilitator superfamily (MFS) profile domain-containing protein n=1 Tax=Diversispora epigaea TaxID=1348612 RepID=A0A397IYG2_9GLOM|nr:hypothetical protein Glove_124g17 [Diversispora epigaea]
MSNLSSNDQVDFSSKKIIDSTDSIDQSSSSRNLSGPLPQNVQNTELLENNDEISQTSETTPLIPITKKKDTPLPKSQLFILAVVVLCEPINFTILLPFVYFMVKGFNITDDEKEIGRYAGLIASSFFFAQFCCSIFWGHMSDRYGRRPILLFGLFGNVIGITLFGLSRSLIWAIITRSSCGILNGNIGVAKSMLGEITDKTNQAKAFSIFGFCWGFGTIIGPMIGGFLSNPAEQFPSIFGDWTFFKIYPYFLPCAFAGLFSLTGFTVGYFNLIETHYPNSRRNQDIEQKFSSQQPPRKLSQSPELHQSSQSQLQLQSSQQSSYGTINQSNCNSRKTTTTITSTDNDNNDNNNNNGDDQRIQKKDNKTKISKITRIAIISHCILSFHAIFFDEVYTLYAVTKIYDGGLGFSAAKLALTLACMGFIQLFSQFIIYPWLARRINIAKIYPLIWFSYIPIYLSFPTINKMYIFLSDKKIESVETIIWFILLPFLTVRFFLNVFSYTSSMLFINNSATSDILGTVNGIAQASASFVRTIGPALGGFFWSWSLTNNLKFPFDSYFAFIVLSVVALIGGYQSTLIPHNLSAANNSDKEITNELCE